MRKQTLQNIAFKTVEPGEYAPHGVSCKAWPKGSSVLIDLKTGFNDETGAKVPRLVTDDLTCDVWTIDEDATRELRSNPKADIEKDERFFRLTKYGETSEYMFSKAFGLKESKITWSDQMDHNNHHNLYLVEEPAVTAGVGELMPTLKKLAVQIANLNKAGV